MVFVRSASGATRASVPSSRPSSTPRCSSRVWRAFSSLALALVLLAGPTLDAGGLFRRADPNDDGEVDLADAIFTLNYLFRGRGDPSCIDAADSNDDGEVDLADAIFTLNFLFRGGREPPPPGPFTPGSDPTPDSLGCGAELPEGARVVVLLPGQSLSGGLLAPLGAGKGGESGDGVGAAAVEELIAGEPFTVRVRAVDRFDNPIDVRALPEGLRITLTFPVDPAAPAIEVPPLDATSQASVSVTNLLASSQHRIVPVLENTGALTAVPSSTYSVQPGPTADLVVLLPGQTLNSGVRAAPGAPVPSLDPDQGVVRGVPFDGESVHPGATFRVRVVAVDRHGNWNFRTSPGTAVRALLASDDVLVETGGAVEATNELGRGELVVVQGNLDVSSFAAGRLVRVRATPVDPSPGEEVSRVVAVVPGASVTLDRLERGYLRPNVTPLDVNFDPAERSFAVGQRFGTSISGIDAATSVPAPAADLVVRIDDLPAAASLSSAMTGLEVAGALQLGVRAQALDDGDRFSFQSAFSPEFSRYVLVSGSPARVQDPQVTVRVDPSTTATAMLLDPPDAVDDGIFLDTAADLPGFPRGTEMLRFSRGIAFFEAFATSSDPEDVRHVVVVSDPQSSLPGAFRSSAFKVRESSLAVAHVELRDADTNGAIDSAEVVFTVDLDEAALPPAERFSVVLRRSGIPLVAVPAVGSPSLERSRVTVTFGSELPTTGIDGISFRVAEPAMPLAAGAGRRPVEIGPRVVTSADLDLTGRSAVLVDKAPPVFVDTELRDLDADGRPEQVRLVFSEDIRIRAGRALAVGNPIDDPDAVSVAAGETVTLSIDTDTVTATFRRAHTGLRAIARALEDALVVRSGELPRAEVRFEGPAAGGPGRLVLYGGEGAGRSVRVLGGTAAARLGFDGSQFEVTGTDDRTPDLDDFFVLSADGRDLLDPSRPIVVSGAALFIPLSNTTPDDMAGVSFFITDDFNETFLTDTAGNEVRVVSNLPGIASGDSSGFIRIRDTDSARDDGVLTVDPGLVVLDASASLIGPSAVADVRFDLVSLSGMTSTRFLEPLALAGQGPGDDLFPDLDLATPVEVVFLPATGAGTAHVVRLTLTLRPGTFHPGILTDSAGRIRREFQIHIRDLAPVADAGPDRLVVSTGGVLTLDGTLSRDPNLEDLRSTGDFEWSVELPSGKAAALTGPQPTFTPSQPGAYRVTLTVRDAVGNASLPAESSFVAFDPNDSARFVPSADAGLDQVARVGATVTLDGRNSRFAGDTEPARFAWTQTSGPAVVLSGGGTALPSFTPPEPGTYTFRLAVTDAAGARPSLPDTVTVVVVDDLAAQPRFVPLAAPRAMGGGGAGGSIHVYERFVLDGSRSQDDGTIHTFTWRQVGGLPLRGLPVTSSAALVSVRPVVAGTYAFELSVTDDSGLSSSFQDLKVQVLPEGARSPVLTVGGDLTVSTGTFDLTGASADFDPLFELLGVRWTQLSGPPVRFSDTGALSPTVTTFDSGEYIFELHASTNTGFRLSGTRTVVVNLPARPLPSAVLDATEGMTDIVLDGTRSSPSDPGNNVNWLFGQKGGLRGVLMPLAADGSRVRFLPPVPATYSFALRVHDPVAGLASSTAFTPDLSLDNDAPPPPLLVGTAPASPSNDPMPRVEGTAEAGAAVEVFADSACTGAPAATGMASAAGTFSFAVPVTRNASVTLRAVAVDRAGNSSACSDAVVYVHDDVPPSVSITRTVPPSPSSDPMPVVEGTAEPGAAVEVYVDSDCTGVPAATGTASAAGTFSFNVDVTRNASVTLRAVAVDAAGNRSACSTAVVYVHDDIAPVVSIVRTVPLSPSSDPRPLVEGTAEPGATVEVFVDTACTGAPAATGMASAAGTFSFGVDVPRNVSVTLRAVATDAADNRSSCSDAVVYVHDDDPPVVSIVRTVPPSPSIDPRPLVEGTAEAGATVQVFVDSACTGAPAATGMASAAGTFSFGVDVTRNASVTLRAVAVDAAGNRSSCSDAVVYVHDDTPPAVPLIGGTNPPSPSSDDTPFIFGSAEPAAAVDVFTNASCAGPPAATGSAAPDGSFSVEVTVARDAAAQLTVRARDAAGNASDCSSSVTYVHFSVGNDPPVVTSVSVAGAVVASCAELRYTVRDAESDRVDVVLQWRGGSSGDFSTATQAGSAPGSGVSGVYRLATSPAGREHRFVWNSSADLPSGDTTTVQLRVTPIDTETGAPGTAFVLSDVEVRNEVDFAPAVSLTAPNAVGLVAADFNRDGRLDLAAADADGDAVTVFLQDPVALGSFLSGRSFSAGPGPTSLAAGDLERDGILDLVVSLEDVDAVVFLQGDGSGNFNATETALTGAMPARVAVADLSGDGLLDVAAANPGDGTVSVSLRNAAGFFEPPTLYSAGAGARDLAIGDLNRDGRPDLVVSLSLADSLAVFLQDSMTRGAFLPASTQPVGRAPRGLAIADFNRDGRLDAASANELDDSVSVLLSDGMGGFSLRTDVAAGAGVAPTGVAALDVNGDLRVDLAVAGSGSGEVLVFLQDDPPPGTALSFGARKTITVSMTPLSTLAADLNHDGSPDIASTDRAGSTLSVSLASPVPACEVSAGAGTTQVVGAASTHVVAGDLNFDGKLDTVTADAGGFVTVHLGHGNSRNVTASVVATGADTRHIALGDLTGDGVLDLVAANAGANNVTVHRGNGTGGFAAPSMHGTGTSPVHVSVADVTGDALADVLVVNLVSEDLSVFLNDGAGGLSPAPGAPVALGPGARSLAVGRFSDDAALDAAAALSDAGAVLVLAGDGAGRFTPLVSFAVAGRPVAVAAGDVDGDGRADLVTANEDTGTAAVFLNQGGATFVEAAGSPFATGAGARHVVVADVDRDQLPDVVVSNRLARTVSVHFGSGSGQFTAAVHIVTAAEPVAAAVADLGGDRVLDVAVASGATDTLTYFRGRGGREFFASPNLGTTAAASVALARFDADRNGTVDIVQVDFAAARGDVLLSDGAGRVTFQSSFTTLPDARSLAAADFDRDGIDDIVSASRTIGIGEFLHGDGMGNFSRVTTFGGGWIGPAAVAAADLNRDGILDLIVANSGAASVNVLRGVGTGSFTGAATVATGSQPLALAIGDVDRDGIPDLAAASSGSNTVTVHRGLGAFGFALLATLSTGASPAGVSLGDLDLDGDLDLVASNRDDNTLSVFLGASGGAFGPPLMVTTTSRPTSVSIGDVTGDGKPDVVIVGSDNRVTVHRGFGTGDLDSPEEFVTSTSIISKVAGTDTVVVLKGGSVFGCAVGRFEHLGGPFVQRAVTFAVLIAPFVVLVWMRRRERRRREAVER
jgi:hypothetical protein